MGKIIGQLIIWNLTYLVGHGFECQMVVSPLYTPNIRIVNQRIYLLAYLLRTDKNGRFTVEESAPMMNAVPFGSLI